MTKNLWLLAAMATIGSTVPASAQDWQAVQVAQLETKEEEEEEQGVGLGNGGVFSDDFDGAELGQHWEVINPDPDGFIAEDGELLIASGKKGLLSDGSMPNLFRLAEPLPDGDWVATTRVVLDAQTGNEGFLLVLYDDMDNYIGVSVYTRFECCNTAALYANAIKRSKGEATGFDRKIWSSERVPEQVFSALARDMPAFSLRLEKRGRSYYPAVKLEGVDQGADWIELERLVELRAKGSLAFGLYQYEDTKGETIATVDWVRVEPAS